jgi:hypothetical protein
MCFCFFLKTIINSERRKNYEQRQEKLKLFDHDGRRSSSPIADAGTSKLSRLKLMDKSTNNASTRHPTRRESMGEERRLERL